MSQWPNSTPAHHIPEATRLSVSPAPAATSGARKKAERAFIQLAHFSQPEPEAPSSTGAPLTIETRKEIRNRSAFSRNETKKETVLSQSGGTRRKKKTLVVALSKPSKPALNSRSVSTYCKAAHHRGIRMI